MALYGRVKGFEEKIGTILWHKSPEGKRAHKDLKKSLLQIILMSKNYQGFRKSGICSGFFLINNI